MLKRTIYSVMALSLTLMPMSEVFAADPATVNWDNTYPIPSNPTDGVVVKVINTNDQMLINNETNHSWPDKTYILNDGGTVNISNYTKDGIEHPTQAVYTQTGGSLYLQSSGKLVLQGGDGSIAEISNGNVHVGYGEGASNAELTIGTGARITSDATVSLYENNKIILMHNASGSPSLVLDSNDKWYGTIKNGELTTTGGTGDARLSITGGFKKDSTGIYNQVAGTLSLDNSATAFDLNNSADSITGGQLIIGTTTTGNNLTVSKGSVSGYTNASSPGVDIAIKEGNTLTISDTGSVVIDSYAVGSSSLGDDWDGNIVVSGGTLTLQNRSGDYIDETSTTKTYNQTGGTLNLGNASGASYLTLNQGSKITDGTVKINNGSSLAFNNKATDNQAAIITDGNDSNALSLSNNSTLKTLTNTNVDSAAYVSVGAGSTLNVNAGEVNLSNNDDWSGAVSVTGGTLNLDNMTHTTTDAASYNQSAGILNLKNGSSLTLKGLDAMEISGGTVNIGSDTDINNSLNVARGGKVGYDAQVNLNAGNYIILSGNAGSDPSLALGNQGAAGTEDTWAGTILNEGSGYLKLEGFNNVGLPEANTAVYQQTSGNLRLGLDENGKSSVLYLNTPESFISGGHVNIESGNVLAILQDTNVAGKYATVSADASMYIHPNSALVVAGNGTVVLNDNLNSFFSADDWDGHIIVGTVDETGKSAGDTPTLTLRNVTKDFTNPDETGSLELNSGTLNLYGNPRGGSHLTVYGDKVTDNFTYAGGKVNVKGYDKNNLSSLTYKVTKNGTYKHAMPVNMQGNAELIYEMNKHDVTFNNVAPTGTGPNNTMVEKGNGKLTINAPGKDLKMGYNVRVEDGSMTVNAKNMTIGTTYKDADGKKVSYGDLQVGMPKNKAETHFYTSALKNKILGSMNLNNAWYHTTNPASTTSIGKNLHAGSGIDMMYGKINSINLKGTTTVDNLKLKIDVDPATYRADTINSSKVVANKNSKLDLVDYNLLSTPTRDKYTFRVVNAANENYEIASSAQKVVSQRKITWTEMGGYTMIPSAVKGAFDMVLLFHNPQVLRGQVAPNIIYANQQVINNQLFDRMIFSNLPYFNGICTNKTAAADTLYSPYQYSTSDTGLWFKPYANFEKIHMSYVGNVKNSAYGAMIGADFARKQWGSWSFIPSAFIGYNGGYSKYNGYGFYGGSSLLHNGGQAGFMGTLTAKDFVTSFALYAGGYHNHMSYSGGSDDNALWNAGVASKTAYNIHLPWHFILQPTLYMAYNYIGASSYNSFYEGYKTKVDPYNAFSIAPGLSLIWQRETFSIYGLFQAMFNIGSSAGGQIAEIDLPHVGIRDPYFEYGLGASKFFGERYSGYGQVVARSGSRRGVGFQLGLNMKL